MGITANKIVIDNNLQEIFEYPKIDFPFIAWRDDYEKFPQGIVASHWHSDIEFAVLISGELDYYLSDQYLHLKKGDCVFVNSNALHLGVQHSYEKAIMIGITFKPSVFGAISGNNLYSKFFESISNSSIKGMKIDLESEVGWNIKNQIIELEMLDINSCFYELQSLSILCSLWMNFNIYLQDKGSLIEPIITNTKLESNVKQIISYIKSHYMENFNVGDIAKEIGISRTECFRSFKKFTTKTPIEYLLEFRLSSALNMLISTDDTVLEICTKCGFSNSSYFGKRFKERYGVTPMEYRKQNS